MIVDSKNEIAAWCTMLYENPDEYLKLGLSKINSDLFTTTQLMSLYDPGGTKRASAVWLGRELKKAGFKQVNDGATLATAKGPQRLVAVRNIRKWVKEKPAACVSHWNAAFGGSK